MGQLPRVVYFGTPGAFSPAPLAALLAARAPVAAVVVPARAGTPEAARWRAAPAAELRVLAARALPDVCRLAWDHCIPLLEVARPADAVPHLAALRPDLLCVACFPWRLPSSLLQLPRYGALNVHPSLLPAYRGPCPLFWQLRNGETTGGVTVHWMDERLDAGDVAAQAPLPIPEGITGAELQAECARLGGALLVQVARAVADGSAARRRQDEASSSYHHWPRAEDFRIDPCLCARRAFTFARGAATWGQPVIVTGGREFSIRHAVWYSPYAELGQPYRLDADRLQVQFSPGVLHALVG